MIFRFVRGFTLIEILLVLGLVSVVLATIPILDLSLFKKDSRQNEINIFIQDLQRARSAAVNNIDGENHSVSWGKEQIIFERLTGNVSQEYEVVFEDALNGGNNATVTINHEGGIDW